MQRVVILSCNAKIQPVVRRDGYRTLRVQRLMDSQQIRRTFIGFFTGRGHVEMTEEILADRELTLTTKVSSGLWTNNVSAHDKQEMPAKDHHDLSVR